jgi:hypothetical protein
LKFFYKNKNINIKGKFFKKFTTTSMNYSNSTDNNVKYFTKFIIKGGSLIKEKKSITTIMKNFNFFLYYNYDYIYSNYPILESVVVNLVLKKLNFIDLFNKIITLIKPPFIVTSLAVPKKLRRKIKKKYLIKIIYKNENKRIKNSYKQLYHYSKKFIDSNFKVRLYKSFMFSFLDWKNSHLFKLKIAIFKNFFKF